MVGDDYRDEVDVGGRGVSTVVWWIELDDARRNGRPGGAGGGGDRIDLYLHSDGGFVLDTARNGAGPIVGSVGGKNAVVHIVRDMFARR